MNSQNNNNAVTKDEVIETIELADLAVEDTEQIKGGPSSSGLSAGKVSYSDLSVMMS